jgi:hypothetical protein
MSPRSRILLQRLGVCAYAFATAFVTIRTSIAADSCFNLPPGAISWWRAESNALDSVDGNHGVLAGNATFGAGRVGSGFVLDGNRDGVRVGTGTNLHLQDFTVEAWIKRSSATLASFNGNGNGEIFVVGTNPGGWGLRINQADNRLVLGKSGGAQSSSAATVIDTNWHHVAVTRRGTEVVFYVDGVAYQAPAFDPGTFTFAAPAYIGAWLNPFGQVDNSFYGAIDELAVYNRSLTAAEIQAIYTSNTFGKCPPNRPPLAQPQTISLLEDTAQSIALTGFDPDGDQLIYLPVLPGPTNGTLSGTAPNLTYTPNTNYHGPDSFTFTVADAVSTSAVATVFITVRSVNDAPLARIEVSPLTQVLGITNKVVVAAVCGDATVILDGSASSDADGDPLTSEWTEGTNSLGSTAIVTNQFAIGTHEISLTVNDGALTNMANEIVEVVSPAQGLGIIIAYIEETDLGRRNGRPLIASLKAAAASFEDCHPIPGVNQLEAFQNKVRAQIAPLDEELAAKLIEAAQQIIDAVQAHHPTE